MDKRGSTSSSISGSTQLSNSPKKRRSPTKIRKPKTIEEKIENEKIVRSSKIKWKKELTDVVIIMSFKKYNLLNTYDNNFNTVEENKVGCKCNIF